MNIGLLQCDHVAERFRNIAGDYPEMFAAWLADVPHCNLVPFDVCNGVWPASLDDCGAYVCTGSRWSVYDDVAWIHDQKHSYNARMKPARLSSAFALGIKCWPKL